MASIASSPSLPRIAVIGGGAWGINLIRTFHQLGALEAIVEASATRRAELTAQYPDLAIHAEIAEILTNPQIAAVAIATPAGTHEAVATAAIEAGKDVFVEKPMTLTAASAERLVALAEEHQRVLMTGHLLLYQPAIAFIREYLRSGQLGQLHFIHQIRAKLGRARKVEDVLWSFGVHDVAVLLDLIGEAPSEISFHGHSSLNPGIADDTHLHLTFPGGIQAHLHNSWLWPEVARRLTIVGSQGMLVFDETTAEVTLHRKTIADNAEGIPTNRDQGQDVLFSGSGDPLTLELQHFLDCVRSRQQPLSDGRNGLAVVRVLESASPMN